MIPAEFKLIAVALLFAALGIGALELRSAERSIGAAAAKTQCQAQAQATQAAALKQFQQATQTQTEALDAAAKQLAAARADGAGARAATDRLRRTYAAALAASRGASAVGASPAASALDLPADLFSRVVDAAQQYRDAAEDALTAGELCERSYDALTPVTFELKGKLGG